MSLGVRVAVALALALMVGGCDLLAPPFALRTAPAPPQACMDALIGGTLVRHAASGLGIATGDGPGMTVEWPFGYTARDEAGRIGLLDEGGRVVAHVGDEIVVGGGFGTDVWYACGPVSVVTE